MSCCSRSLFTDKELYPPCLILPATAALHRSFCSLPRRNWLWCSVKFEGFNLVWSEGKLRPWTPSCMPAAYKCTPTASYHLVKSLKWTLMSRVRQVHYPLPRRLASLGLCTLLPNFVILPAVREDSRTGVGFVRIATSFYQILCNIYVSTIKIGSIRHTFYNHFSVF